MARQRNWKIRATGLLLLLATIWYLPWLFGHLNWEAPWFSIPFALATIMTAAMTMVTVVNHWQYSVPDEKTVRLGEEPEVVVIIPTYGEPPAMAYETAKSVLQQDYPLGRIKLVIGDDSHRSAIKQVAERLGREHPRLLIKYLEPPFRGDPKRRGEAKAGNLNAAIEWMDAALPDVQFVETRDADDKVGDPSFLRQVIGQLLADPEVAFVQTIKDAEVDSGDPFGNRELLFYRKAMLAKNAANAVFPCGSGVVWRRKALDDIGGFPAWNLVEDLQSGVEALRRGWRGLYLPIVGAVGQTAPEDIPNSVKQRGTWAIDTMRLTFWGNKQGLTPRQHLQFAELGFFYLMGFAVLVFASTPVLTLALDVYPMTVDWAGFAFHFWPYAATVELFLVSLADGLPFEALWRSRQIWLGMAPVYARATLVALFYGPNRKPRYRVTRKQHVTGLYLREVLPQLILLVALISASIYHISTHSLLNTADLGSLFWAGYFILISIRVIRNAWHGVSGDQLKSLLTLRHSSGMRFDSGEESIAGGGRPQ